MITFVRVLLELSGLGLWLTLGYIAVSENYELWRETWRQKLHKRRVSKAMYQAKILLEAMAKAREIERNR